MKHFFLFLLLPSISTAQTTFSGRIVNSSDQTGIPYVNIGIPNENTGTVSDENGDFKIEFENPSKEDSVRISSLGYETLDISILKLQSELQNSGRIELLEKPIALKEIVLSNKVLKEKVVGNTTTAKKTRGGFRGATLGHEVGMKVKVRKDPFQIKEFHVNVLSNTSKTAKFRLNFYSIKDGKPHKKIVQQNIIFPIEKSEGKFTLNLADYGIVIDQDFYFTLELIEDLGENEEVFFSANLLGKAIVFRETSQATWERSGMAGIGMHLTVAY